MTHGLPPDRAGDPVVTLWNDYLFEDREQLGSHTADHSPVLCCCRDDDALLGQHGQDLRASSPPGAAIAVPRLAAARLAERVKPQRSSGCRQKLKDPAAAAQILAQQSFQRRMEMQQRVVQPVGTGSPRSPDPRHNRPAHLTRQRPAHPADPAQRVRQSAGRARDDECVPGIGLALTGIQSGPLSHMLAARRRQPVDLPGPNPFAGLAVRYPCAWACLAALTDTFADGGRGPLRLPAASIPDLPSGDEVVAAPPTGDDGIPLFNAIDLRFDQGLVDLLEQAAEGDALVCTSALSRYSRNSEKLHRILEFLLAHGATVLTTNYLIRPADVWARRGALVKPDSNKPYAGMLDTRGLAGTHRNVAETVARQHGLR